MYELISFSFPMIDHFFLQLAFVVVRRHCHIIMSDIVYRLSLSVIDRAFIPHVSALCAGVSECMRFARRSFDGSARPEVGRPCGTAINVTLLERLDCVSAFARSCLTVQ